MEGPKNKFGKTNLVQGCWNQVVSWGNQAFRCGVQTGEGCWNMIEMGLGKEMEFQA